MSEREIRQAIVHHGKSLYERGLTHGGTGNISVRLEDGWLLTPTGSFLGNLDPDRLSKLNVEGEHVAGNKPTKEFLLHKAMYDQRPEANAIVHLHSIHSVALSVVDGLDPENLLPPITPYYVMRIGAIPLVPYFPPGDVGLADAVGQYSQKHSAVLLAHHGPVVAGKDLAGAVDAVEELEATARLYFMLNGHSYKTLNASQVDELNKRFPH